MASAMASTACRACSAVVSDKTGRQQLSALASSSFVIWAAAALTAQVGAACRRLALRRADSSSSRAAPRCLHAMARVSSSAHESPWGPGSPHTGALPGPFGLKYCCQQFLGVRATGGPYHAFGLAAARCLGVRTAVRSAVRGSVVPTLGATHDQGQFLLVERPQRLLGQRELLLLLHENPPLIRPGITANTRSPWRMAYFIL